MNGDNNSESLIQMYSSDLPFKKTQFYLLPTKKVFLMPSNSYF